MSQYILYNNTDIDKEYDDYKKNVIFLNIINALIITKYFYNTENFYIYKDNIIIIYTYIVNIIFFILLLRFCKK